MKLLNHFCSLIPLDSIVPPLKPSDVGETKGDHHAHAEHAMIPLEGNDSFLIFLLFCFSQQSQQE